jgi:hypothetical protein
VLLFPETPPLDELQVRRAAAIRQVAALDLEIVREKARDKARSSGECVASAERGANAVREWRQVGMIIAGALLLVGGVVALFAAVLHNSDPSQQQAAWVAAALLFVSLLLTLLSLTSLTVVATRAVVIFATAVALYSAIAALPMTWLVLSVQIVCMAVMVGSYIWVLLKDPEVVARRQRRNEWYVAADWAADYTGSVDYESQPCMCERCEEQEVSPPPVDTIQES